MGRGIALLLARLMAEDGGEERHLHLIDSNSEGLDNLRRYLERFGESTGHGPLLSSIHITTNLSALADSHLVFEAVPEVEAIKVETLKQARQLAPSAAMFFTNTSSIPICTLEEQSGLHGRLVGFHFYNPPPVQELLELIQSDSSPPAFLELARELGRRLGKRVVEARDVAAFIGNGHFVREALYALQLAKEMRDGGASWPRAIYSVNRATEQGLVRPMGIFQVVDYAGIDIVEAIAGVMADNMEDEEFDSALLKLLLERRIRGGQDPKGGQHSGFFGYAGRQIESVYDLERDEYASVTAVVSQIGGVMSLARAGESWGALRTGSGARSTLEEHFHWLAALKSAGAQLAQSFARASARIARKLVDEGVAACDEDVNTVVTCGFAHLYGPLESCVHPLLIEPSKKE